MSETISLPSILIAGALIFFAVRYFFLTPVSSENGRRTGHLGARHVDVNKVNQVAQMFPQLDRRTIAWDLSRNGGSVSATTEKVLSGQALDVPPPSYQPANLSPASASASSARTTSSSASAKTGQDLIARYNLGSKLKTQEDDAGEESESISKGWANTKTERAALFAKRREEMILNARKKMEDAARREAKGKGKALD